MDDICLRLMIESDVPGADELRRLAGWNQTPEDWRALLQLEPDGCFVAVKGEEVVGTVTTTSYGRELAWIGMMLVHPEYRRQGIATRLMGQALDYLGRRRLRCVGLDATPLGLPLYEKLGFVAEWTLTRWQRPELPEPPPPSQVSSDMRKPTEADWAALIDLDAAAFGLPRPELVTSLVRRSAAALLWPAEGRPLGWGLLRPGTNSHYLGPLTCTRREGAQALAKSLLAQTSGRSVFWDVLDGNIAAKAIAEKNGFAPQRTLTRMYRGTCPKRAVPLAQFAIADPAVG